MLFPLGYFVAVGRIMPEPHTNVNSLCLLSHELFPQMFPCQSLFPLHGTLSNTIHLGKEHGYHLYSGG
tara:strand:- start:283 stop:486 length:204 start_codon:yes stop_codon:yes gene_type:complete